MLDTSDKSIYLVHNFFLFFGIARFSGNVRKSVLAANAILSISEFSILKIIEGYSFRITPPQPQLLNILPKRQTITSFGEYPLRY